MLYRPRQPVLRALACASVLSLAAMHAFGQQALTAEDTPRELQGVGVTEHLNEVIPLDLAFKNESGAEVRLREFFTPGRPVILVLGYYRCPMLCDLTRNGLVNAMNELEWSAGREFNVLFVSINPDEEPGIAAVKKEAYLTQYRRDSAVNGLHFLVGNQREIELLAGATGFGYRYDPKADEYAHTSTIMFVTPEGRLSRYMNNVKFEPRDVKLALVEASEGAIGSPMDKFLLFMCYHYDPLRGSYSASAVKVMRLGGLVTLMVMTAGLGILWMRGSSRHSETAGETSGEVSSVLGDRSSVEPDRRQPPTENPEGPGLRCS
jgi:protein SCO1